MHKSEKMKNVIETTLLEFDKSNFIIQLVEMNFGTPYIEINQTINAENSVVSLKLNPAVVSDIIKVLQNYYAKIDQKYTGLRTFISDDDQQKMVKRYLKGDSIQDLALQFDQSPELIEMILRNKNIVVVSNNQQKRKK